MFREVMFLTVCVVQANVRLFQLNNLYIVSVSFVNCACCIVLIVVGADSAAAAISAAAAVVGGVVSVD